MKNTKKWLSLLLVMALVFACLPQMTVPARAAVTSGQCGANLTWSLDSNTGVLTITGTGAMWDWNSPSPFEEEKSSPFAEDESIQSVILPDGLTHIGSNAFYFCESLSEVTIPPSLEEIGSSAFLGCAKPIRVNIQDLSAWCKKSGGFSNSYYLYMSGAPITDLIIPEGLTEIPSSAFYNCDSIVSATIPDGVTSIGSHAFSFCENLMNVSIPGSVKRIGDNAFQSCKALKSITLPEGVESIGQSAFLHCKSLYSITLPDSLTFIDSGILEYTAIYDTVGSWGGDGLLYCGKWLIDTRGSMTAVTIKEGTRGIAAGAFNNREALESVEIPSSVKYINDYAFRNCVKLTEVTLPDGLEIIGDDAFIGCTGLTSMTVPDSVTSIGDYAIGIANIRLVYMSSDFIIDKIPDFTIIGSKGSAAQTYAEENEIAFVELKPDADMTALDAAIAAADALKEADYTSESFAKLKAAVEAAKALPKNADQAEVDAAAKAVNDAVDALVFSPQASDKAALAKAIAEAESIDKTRYTEESVAMMDLILAGAKTALASDDLNEIKKATETLNKFLASLVEQPGGKADLEKAIEKAEKLDKSKYTEESVAALDLVLDGARAAMDSGDPAKIEKAAKALKAAVEAMKEKADGKDDFLFDDVQSKKTFYYDAVYWAYNASPQITNGLDKSHFGPLAGCTRGQVVTFLWRAAKCPEPKSTKTAFTDVGEKAFYAKAVAWAVEQGITKGMSETSFAPDATCTRGQIVTFLWRFRESPAPKDTRTAFTDVPEKAFYAKAVAWAVEKGVTKGMTETAFAPDDTCTRGQIVTFLHRAMK